MHFHGFIGGRKALDEDENANTHILRLPPGAVVTLTNLE